jgi:hypothetical protein
MVKCSMCVLVFREGFWSMYFYTTLKMLALNSKKLNLLIFCWQSPFSGALTAEKIKVNYLTDILVSKINAYEVCTVQYTLFSRFLSGGIILGSPLSRPDLFLYTITLPAVSHDAPPTLSYTTLEMASRVLLSSKKSAHSERVAAPNPYPALFGTVHLWTFRELLVNIACADHVAMYITSQMILA